MRVSDKQVARLLPGRGLHEDRGANAFSHLSQREIALLSGLYEIAEDSGFEITRKPNFGSSYIIRRTGKPGAMPYDLSGSFTSRQAAVDAIERYLESQ